MTSCIKIVACSSHEGANCIHSVAECRLAARLLAQNPAQDRSLALEHPAQAPVLFGGQHQLAPGRVEQTAVGGTVDGLLQYRGIDDNPLHILASALLGKARTCTQRIALMPDRVHSYFSHEYVRYAQQIIYLIGNLRAKELGQISAKSSYCRFVYSVVDICCTN